MIKQKIDICGALAAAGFTSYKMKQTGDISQSEYSRMRSGGVPGSRTLDAVCRLLHMQPGDLIEWVPDHSPDKPGQE